MKKISYAEMAKLFRETENEGKEHVTGYIIFTEDSFKKPFTEEQRTYVTSSDNKAFRPNMCGYSIFGAAIDGTDPCVRLENYMREERGGKDGWKVEYCYLKEG